MLCYINNFRSLISISNLIFCTDVYKTTARGSKCLLDTLGLLQGLYPFWDKQTDSHSMSQKYREINQRNRRSKLGCWFVTSALLLDTHAHTQAHTYVHTHTGPFLPFLADLLTLLIWLGPWSYTLRIRLTHCSLKRIVVVMTVSLWLTSRDNATQSQLGKVIIPLEFFNIMTYLPPHRISSLFFFLKDL